MKRFQMHADHLKRQVCEPLDISGHLLTACDSNDQMIGTVRFNVGVDQHFGIYTNLYHLQLFSPFFPEKVSITTKLMISPHFRGSSLALSLATVCYARGLDLGTCFDFIDCNPPLVAFFERLGYRQTVGPIDHPEYGTVVPLVLVMHDIDHLTTVGSPFASIARRSRDKFNSVEFFHRMNFECKPWSSALCEKGRTYEYDGERGSAGKDWANEALHRRLAGASDH
jgi:hypothetical protein